MSFICHIHNYTEYNDEWNVFSAFNPSKWSSGQPTLRRPGSSWGFGALLKGLTSVVDTSCHNLGLPRVSSPTLYPLGHDCPPLGHDCPKRKKCTALYWKRRCYHHSEPLVVVHFSNMTMILNTHLRPLLDFWRRTGWKWFSGQVCLLIWFQSNTYGEFWRDKLSITLHPASNL